MTPASSVSNLVSCQGELSKDPDSMDVEMEGDFQILPSGSTKMPITEGNDSGKKIGCDLTKQKAIPSPKQASDTELKVIMVHSLALSSRLSIQ